MTPFLKVKIKALAAEAVIIRKLERKFKKPKLLRTYKTVIADGKQVIERIKNPKYRPLPASYEACKDDKERDRFQSFWGLRNHRILVVRKEARCSLIAYGFIRGLRYGQIEDTCWTKPDWKLIHDIINRFGGKISKERLEAWAAGDNLPAT